MDKNKFSSLILDHYKKRIEMEYSLKYIGDLIEREGLEHFIDLITFTLNKYRYEIPLEFIFLKYLDFFLLFNKENWDSLLIKLIEYTKTEGPLILESYIIFMYKYLEVDFLSTLLEQSESNSIIKPSVIYFNESKGVLYADKEHQVIILDRYKVSKDKFNKIKKRILREGGKKAVEINVNIHKHRTGIQYYSVNEGYEMTKKKEKEKGDLPQK